MSVSITAAAIDELTVDMLKSHLQKTRLSIELLSIINWPKIIIILINVFEYIYFFNFDETRFHLIYIIYLFASVLLIEC